MDVRRIVRWTAAAAGIAAACVGAGSAFADVLPPPPVLTPPPLPVPVPTLPAPTPPSAPSTPSVPSTPSIPSTLATAPAPGAQDSTTPIAGVAPSKSVSGGSAAAGGSGPASGSGSGSGSASSSSRTGGERSIARLHSSRPWIAAHGPSARRRTTLTFRLREAARVVFTVRQVSPVCRVAALFTVRGHAGLNKVPFTGRLRGRTLPSGTYQISARTRGGGTVLRVTVVVVESGVPSPTELESARRSNVCGVGAALASNSLATGPGSGAPEQQRTAKLDGNAVSAASSGVAAASDVHGSPFSAARVSKNITDPLVIMALAAAALLLGFASLPEEAMPDPRLTEVLARHRVGLAFAGVGALALAVIELAFG